VLGLLVAALIATAEPAVPRRVELSAIPGTFLFIGPLVKKASGTALLRADGLTLRAHEIIHDGNRNEASAGGDVRLTHGMLAAVAGRLELDIDKQLLTLFDAVVMHKEGVLPEELAKLSTREELLRAGKDNISLSGARVQRDGLKAQSRAWGEAVLRRGDLT
jgi:hypothetical protein